jgi:hypothetical protein
MRRFIQKYPGPLAFLLMLAFALLLVFGLSAPVHSEMKEGDRVRVQLSMEPCQAPEVAERIPEDLRPLFKAAIVDVAGEPTPACWRPVFQRPGSIFLLLSDGQGFYARMAPQGPTT